MPRPFPKEFREDVVRVAGDREPRQTIKQVAADFGIAESCLRNWLRAADVEDGVKAGTTSGENAELREARKRIRLLEQENEGLRRAAAYLVEADRRLLDQRATITPATAASRLGGDFPSISSASRPRAAADTTAHSPAIGMSPPSTSVGTAAASPAHSANGIANQPTSARTRCLHYPVWGTDLTDGSPAPAERLRERYREAVLLGQPLGDQRAVRMVAP